MPQKRDDLYTRAFAVMLKVERRRRNWSTEDLAKRCHVTRSGISAWETGHCAPTFGNILKIAGVFQVKLSDMMRAVENVAAVLEKNHDQAIESAAPTADPKRESLGASGD
jgi:transcriptional regulator with XRE-family HTH domain